MELVSFEWILGALFVGVNAYARYNTPTSNRESTTFQNFILYFMLYFFSVLVIYVVLGAMFDSSPATIGKIYGFLVANPTAELPGELSKLSAPLVSALFLSTLLPSLPWLSRYDQAILQFFWDRGHIPTHVPRKAAIMRRSPFGFSPQQIKQLGHICEALQIDPATLDLDANTSLDYHWARINVLLESIDPWHDDDLGRLRRFMQEHKESLGQLRAKRDEINREYADLKGEQLDLRARAKIEHYLEKSIAEFFHDITVFVAAAVCVAELTSSGRSSRLSQLGFEGGAQTGDRLSVRQSVKVLLAILLTFLAISVIQEISKDPGDRRFSNVWFITFLMMFTYGAAVHIALLMKNKVSLGYNELTRQRPWFAYFFLSITTGLGWLFVSLSYRYIPLMLKGADSQENLQSTVNAINWSYPYALQSIALAVAISIILDLHQSRDMSSHLTLRTKCLDIAVSVLALSLASLTAFCWLEGLGPFAGYATKDPAFVGKTPMGWFIFKDAAVGAVVGWLVPQWIHLNRTRAPEQIVGRLIAMNKKDLSREIRNLKPDELLQLVATIAAAVASIDDEIARNELDVYLVICSNLAGLPSSDVDIEFARSEFDLCLTQLQQEQSVLDRRLDAISRLPLLSALMPYIAQAIAFADGVYLEREKKLVDKIKGFEYRMVVH